MSDDLHELEERVSRLEETLRHTLKRIEQLERKGKVENTREIKGKRSKKPVTAHILFDGREYVNMDGAATYFGYSKTTFNPKLHSLVDRGVVTIHTHTGPSKYILVDDLPKIEEALWPKNTP